MNIIDKLKKTKKDLKEKNKYFKKNYINNKGYIPDRFYLQKIHKERYGEELNLKNPTLFCEKIQWLKLYYRDPLFPLLADKYRNRLYIEKITGKDYSVPILGKWDRAEDIDFSTLPKSFVIKTNHDSHPYIVLDKDKADLEDIRHRLYVKLNISKYISSREWAYKNIKRCIIAEELLGDGKTELLDYKFFCFNGEPKYLDIFSESTDGKHGKINFFDMNFNRLPIKHKKHPIGDKPIPKPENFEEMVSLAKLLSQNIPFIRVDMFNVKGKIYIGELTFYPAGGIPLYEPREAQEMIGSWLELPEKNGWKKFKNRDKQWLKKSLM